MKWEWEAPAFRRELTSLYPAWVLCLLGKSELKCGREKDWARFWESALAVVQLPSQTANSSGSSSGSRSESRAASRAKELRSAQHLGV